MSALPEKKIIPSKKSDAQKSTGGVKKKTKPRSRLKPEEILEMFVKLADDRPNPETELEYNSAFTLVVAVALSAQATDVGVNKATRLLFAAADTPQAMLDLGEDGIAQYIKTIGLWRNKAKNVLAMSQMIIDDFNGEVPSTRDDLVLLPGVGRKTANVVLNEVFGQPTIAVDTHIFRVSNRTGLAPGDNPDRVEDLLVRVVPETFKKGAHHWLILHGRYVCVARQPKCATCVIYDICKFKEKTA